MSEPREPATSPRPFVIGVAGGSGSGKTTIARALAAALGDSALSIEQDCYYRDLSHLPFDARVRVNFDHPDALELPLLVAHLEALCAWQPIQRPRYDFEHHVREPVTERLEPRPVVLVEGILVLADEGLRRRFDLKIYVDTDADIRLMRRIRRDMEHRGREFTQIRRQYYETVRPMHLAFVEPSKRFADVIIPEGGQNPVALDLILGKLREFLRTFPADAAAG
ncbi:MAG: uridine kinase [Polyangiaceae bacterium]|nr:uridine kinase [Polyangiaceae bacterium]